MSMNLTIFLVVFVFNYHSYDSNGKIGVLNKIIIFIVNLILIDLQH